MSKLPPSFFFPFSILKVGIEAQYSVFIYLASWCPGELDPQQGPQDSKTLVTLLDEDIKWDSHSYPFSQSPRGCQEAGRGCASPVVGELGGCTCSAHCRKRRMCSAQLPTAASFKRRHSSKASNGSAQACRICRMMGWEDVQRAMLILRW